MNLANYGLALYSIYFLGNSQLIDFFVDF